MRAAALKARGSVQELARAFVICGEAASIANPAGHTGTRANAGPSIGGAGLRQASATLTQRACGDYEDGSDDL